ncbi:hypothetical protein J1N35_022411 [Gossypium stocksii]|uniref:DUF4283 domain-containing protein n=1 Tax=Gossypium stocksii TaxID=47602 RepID=A0A9D3VGF6_9ROSI|nr:hypothetical protein J1N35_022411 [Gossypium stocksii]
MRHFLVEIPDEELIEMLRQTEWSYLKEFFVKVEPWSEKLKIEERVSWIEVSGVPLHCWNYKTFKRVAGIWGKLVSIGENLTKVNNFEKLELLISITQSILVDEVISMEVANIIFSIRVRERGLSELNDDSFNSKASWKKNEEDSISGAGSAVITRPKISSEGRVSVKSGALMVVNLENGNSSNECQKKMEVENDDEETEHVSKEFIMGEVDESNIGMERALKDVRDMGLGVVEVNLGVSKGGGFVNGSSLGVGCMKAGFSNPEEFIGPVEENKKGLKKKIRSMYEIQSSSLTSKEKKKRDRAMLKEEGREFCKEDERIVNLSLSDSDISNRMRVIFKEANNTWAIGKKLRLSVHGDEEEVIE